MYANGLGMIGAYYVSESSCVVTPWEYCSNSKV